MGQISEKLRRGEDGRLTYWCQGCEEPHSIMVGVGAGPRWGWDGNAEAPTFSPSVLVTSGHFVAGRESAGCWCKFNAEAVAKGEEPSGFECRRCHTFIRGGMVEFLGDCSHALAGQTLPLPTLPEHLRDEAREA